MYCLYIFKADWCGHCQNFLNNEFFGNNNIKSFLDNNKDFYLYKIADANKDENIINLANVEGFPTIRLYKVNNENNKKYINIKDPIYEFDKRDKNHIITTLKTLKNNSNNHKNNNNNNNKIKASYKVLKYTNDNGKISGQSSNMICQDGKCKYINKIMNEDGTVNIKKDVLPFNYDDFDKYSYQYYNNLLDVQNNY